MGRDQFDSKAKRTAHFRSCNVSSYTTELLEIHADDPQMHVLFIPGNPGVVAFYKDFVESLYEFLEGHVSVTAIGHTSHTKKMDFIKQELENIEVPIILVGHSIGSYMAIDIFRRSLEKVTYCVGLYPFLEINPESKMQPIIQKIAASQVLSVAISLIIASLKFLPSWALRLIVTNSLGKSWSATALEATCSHLVQYHTIRNSLFMTMTEFQKLTETPDWAFMRENREKLAFLFGVDDHWAPLQMFEEVPGIALSTESNHTHTFSCTEAGSSFVAKYVASLIKNQLLCSGH
ncbi:hypothetical protein RGQ29_025752 [Quercus rubra]|uniref:Lipid droplet-associated hydrolase n=1 Tax=Quercus rubra TaxID=3512 RepID=A0AAN7EZ84_QUERU|nr:hypothetical protein RGQ29_025752 [Quercus rubra]